MPKSLYHPKHWPTWLGLAILRLFALLPVTWLYFLAKGLGLLGHKFAQRRRQIVETNIALCFPEKTAEQQATLVRENFINTAYGIVEIMLAFWASREYILKHSEVRGLEHLEQAKAEGRGVLLMGLHVTTLEFSRWPIAARWPAIDISYKEAANPAFDYYLHKQRQKSFANVIEKYNMHLMMKNLKSGNVIWLASDQDFGRSRSVFAPFFHELAATPGNLGRISKMTGAKPLFYNHYRVMKNGKPYFIGEVSDPFKEGFGDNAEKNAAQFNQAVADAITPHPEQYLWVHERFKTRPDPNSPRLYPRKKKKKKSS